ncbi:glycosyltransferase [Patulibacter defluvii]|uniref:glycosyltransferase n=1 Tax=Patulibacter defluvii TaxID=3095358 RepID=UPI002A75708A|nr:glycosyltransferase [Patulibacter sp. DM4]
MTASPERPTTAIFIPVKNAGELFRDVVRAAAAQGADEFLVIDSGSTDDSVAIARAAGATVIEIPPESYSHGLTRNMALEHTSADILAYITQDASPVPGWLDAYVDAFAEDERIAVVFGPHLPRPGTSPMIARELLEFFAPFSPDGRVQVQRRIDEPGYNPEFLHNANAAYRRAALEQVPFRDIAYAEDQAYGQDALAAGWRKAYQPRAGVLHAHDFPWWQFMRRYFDEYRGLYETVGLQMSFYPRGIARDAWRLAQADARWLEQLGVLPGTRRRWFLRSLAHHGGRRLAAVAGGRAHELPAPVQRLLSLEGRAGDTGNPQPPLVADGQQDETVRVDPAPFATPAGIVREVQAEGALPLAPAGPDADGPLTLVLLVELAGPDDPALDPHLDLLSELEARGHRCTLRIHDPEHRLPFHAQRTLAARLAGRRHAVHGAVEIGFGGWTGADVAIATGWRTAYLALRLPGLAGRVQLLRSLEADAMPPSLERTWAAQTLDLDLHPLCLGAPLAAAVGERTGRPATAFAPWVDHERFAAPGGTTRRDDTIVLPRPAGDPHGGGAAGLVLDELLRRRAGLQVVGFGPAALHGLSFRHRSAGEGGPEDHVELLARGTVALTLDAAARPEARLPLLAAGLPCVGVVDPLDPLAGEEGPIALAPPTVPALADALERLLDDPEERARRSADGVVLAARHSLAASVDRVEAGLRAAISGAAIPGRA